MSDGAVGLGWQARVMQMDAVDQMRREIEGEMHVSRTL
jgi:hypothetical protein